MNMTPENHQLIEDLSIANRILYLEGVVDGFGHISARDAQDTTRFWIAKSMAPALVTPSDILQCDLEGVVHDPQNRTCYVERFIHSEIYRARPDVQAIVHSHSMSVIPFGVTSQRLRPICHMAHTPPSMKYGKPSGRPQICSSPAKPWVARWPSPWARTPWL